MTKTSRIMLAVLALCGTSAAMAQSSVNLYGRVNTTVEQWKVGSESTTGLRTNSSFIGFRGQEDLGAGVKVGFQLEGNFGSDDGAGANGSGLDFKRHSELNLSGNFGTLRLGKFNAGSYLATADYISMHNHDTGLSADALYAYVFPEGNQVAYRTTDFGGLTAEIQYGFGEDVVTDIKNQAGAVVNRVLHDDAIDLAVNYANGPLGLGFGYTQAKRVEQIIGSAKEQQFAIRGSYALGALTLGAYYQHHKDDRGSAADAKRNTYRLSAMYAVGASEFHANVGRADKAKVGGSKVNGSAATQWTLGYNHNLSKRTKAYAYYSKVNNGLNSSFATGTDNADLRAIAVGVRHLF